MGDSIKVRAPFVDPKLVELVFSLPVEWRYSANDPKRFLKQALRGVVPDAILDAPKKGFTVPHGFLQHIVRSSSQGMFNIQHHHFHTLLIEKVLSRLLHEP